jgi:hypothetical protein
MLEIESHVPPAPRPAIQRPFPYATAFQRWELVQLLFAVPAVHDKPSVLDQTLPLVLLGETMTNRRFPFEAIPPAIDVNESPAVMPETLAFDHVSPSVL